jgi:hypothetical protein
MWHACGKINASRVLMRKPEGRRLLGRLDVGGKMILQIILRVKVTNSLMLRTFRLPKISHNAWVADSNTLNLHVVAINI